MLVQIPLISDPQFFQIALDDNFYTLRFFWNRRYEAWTMTIEDEEGINLISGVPLKAGVQNLLSQYNLPLGSFQVVLLEGKEDATEDDLGTRVRLIYGTTV